MPKAKFGLGRGLGALIPESSAPAGLLLVPVDQIGTNPRQPRRALNEAALAELTASVREHGVLQPLIVTRVEAEGGPPYRLIAGERRWQAARAAGLETVPVVVREATPSQTLEWALVENLQRADLNPIEIAGAYKQLVDSFGLTQEMVARAVGRSRPAVANALRLLGLPGPILDALAAGELSEGHARALLALPSDEARLRAWEQVRANDLTVRETEALVRDWLDHGEPTPAAPEATEPERSPHRVDPDTRALEEQLRHVLGTKVALHRGRRGGRLVIYFYSEEEFAGLYDRLRGGKAGEVEL